MITMDKPIGDNHDKHQTLYPYCRVTYWLLGAATNPTYWSDVKIEGRAMYGSIRFDFDASEQGYNDAWKLMEFLNLAYAAGCSDQNAAIRKVLGIKEPRS